MFTSVMSTGTNWQMSKHLAIDEINTTRGRKLLTIVSDI